MDKEAVMVEKERRGGERRGVGWDYDGIWGVAVYVPV